MQFTLAHMKLSRNLPVAIRMIVITPSQQVLKLLAMLALRLKHLIDLQLALSGACATISSDALMNPFDGMHPLVP
jgi:hypothetical protein